MDSNGTLLTPDYIDDLVLEAGVTDIGIEPKAVRVTTFQRITGVADVVLATCAAWPVNGAAVPVYGQS